MNKNLAVLSVFMLLVSLKVATRVVATGPTIVKVDPSLIEYHIDATGQQFTIAVKIVDIMNLYGFDIKFGWNTTFLEYVNRSVYVPRNDSSPEGVLWGPLIPVKDEVNTTAGTYWIAYSSRYPAPPFNGSGTVFNMTFKVIRHPLDPEPNANITLELSSTELSDIGANPIPHTKQHGTVILYALSAQRDIAITNVTPLKTIVGQDYKMNITVTVANKGHFTETFDLTLYANTTTIETKEITLESKASTTITFTWDTTGYVYGNYTIWAYAWPVPGETATEDNTLSDGIVLVTVPGDINGDRKVDVKDLVLCVKAYGSYPNHPNWNPNADINSDGKVDIKDLVTLIKNYGKYW